MSQLDNIVDVTITTTPAPLSTTNYGVPLILGATDPGWSDVAHTYTSPAAMLTDGYALTDPEYIAAGALYGSSITPSKFLVAPRQSTDASQVDTIDLGTPPSANNGALVTGTTYAFTLDGTVITYTTVANDTAQNVLGAFSSQLLAGGKFGALISNNGPIKTLNITALDDSPHVYSAISPALHHVSVSQAMGIASDLANLLTLGNSWYCLLTPGVSETDAMAAAAWVEQNKKLYVLTSDNANNFTPLSTTSLAAKLNAAGYTRTALLPSISAFTTSVDAAWVGANLPASPGSNNWAYSALPGQTPDALTDTQISAALAQSANVFININGAHSTIYGSTASGDYIDTIIGKDWLHSTMQANVFDILRAASAAGSKVPYTDKGATRIGQGVYAAIQQGIQNGFIDGDQPYTVNITKVADVSAANKANRQCPPITFEVVLAGAINTVAITGVLDI